MDQNISAAVETLGQLDEATRAAVLRRARYHERRLKRAEKDTESSGKAGIPLMTLTLATVSLGPLVIGGYTGVELTTIEWIKAYTLYLAAGAATIFLPPGLFLVSRRWRRKTGGWSEAISFVYLIFFVMIASVIVTPALMVLLPFSSSLILFGVVMGIGMPGLALIGILAGGVLELPGVILKGRRRRRRYADTYIVNSLARALIVLHHSPATRPRTFSTAARELEQVAVRLERDLPHFLGAQGDEYPSLREAADEMAAFQRTLGRRLLVPSRAVLAECVGAIRSSFVAAALADWAELPRQQVTSSMRRRTRLAQALSGVRLIVVAVSPIAVARLLDAYDVIDGPASGYAGALAYGWLVLVLLNKLDPDLKDKVALLKDILGMIRGR